MRIPTLGCLGASLTLLALAGCDAGPSGEEGDGGASSDAPIDPPDPDDAQDIGAQLLTLDGERAPPAFTLERIVVPDGAYLGAWRAGPAGPLPTRLVLRVRVPPGVPSARVAIWHLAAVPERLETRPLADGDVEAEVDHFSVFALIEDPDPDLTYWWPAPVGRCSYGPGNATSAAGQLHSGVDLGCHGHHVVECSHLRDAEAHHLQAANFGQAVRGADPDHRDGHGFGRSITIRYLMDDGSVVDCVDAHLCCEPSVSEAELVARGQTIGVMGSCGASTSSHTHWECQPAGGGSRAAGSCQGGPHWGFGPCCGYCDAREVRDIDPAIRSCTARNCTIEQRYAELRQLGYHTPEHWPGRRAVLLPYLVPVGEDRGPPRALPGALRAGEPFVCLLGVRAPADGRTLAGLACRYRPVGGPARDVFRLNEDSGTLPGGDAARTMLVPAAPDPLMIDAPGTFDFFAEAPLPDGDPHAGYPVRLEVLAEDDWPMVGDGPGHSPIIDEADDVLARRSGLFPAGADHAGGYWRGHLRVPADSGRWVRYNHANGPGTYRVRVYRPSGCTAPIRFGLWTDDALEVGGPPLGDKRFSDWTAPTDREGWTTLTFDGVETVALPAVAMVDLYANANAPEDQRHVDPHQEVCFDAVWFEPVAPPVDDCADCTTADPCRRAACRRGECLEIPRADGTACGDGRTCRSGQCTGCAPGDERVCYTGPAGTEGVGRCREGTQVCGDGEWSECVGQRLPRAEICANGEDDDCDGAADEGCAECDGRADGHLVERGSPGPCRWPAVCAERGTRTRSDRVCRGERAVVEEVVLDCARDTDGADCACGRTCVRGQCVGGAVAQTVDACTGDGYVAGCVRNCVACERRPGLFAAHNQDGCRTGDRDLSCFARCGGQGPDGCLIMYTRGSHQTAYAIWTFGGGLGHGCIYADLPATADLRVPPNCPAWNLSDEATYHRYVGDARVDSVQVPQRVLQGGTAPLFCGDLRGTTRITIGNHWPAAFGQCGHILLHRLRFEPQACAP